MVKPGELWILGNHRLIWKAFASLVTTKNIRRKEYYQPEIDIPPGQGFKKKNEIYWLGSLFIYTRILKIFFLRGFRPFEKRIQVIILSMYA